MKIVVVNKHTIRVEIRCALLLYNFLFLQETPHHVYLVMEVCGALPFFYLKMRRIVMEMVMKQQKTTKFYSLFRKLDISSYLGYPAEFP